MEKRLYGKKQDEKYEDLLVEGIIDMSDDEIIKKAKSTFPLYNNFRIATYNGEMPNFINTISQ